MQTMTVVIKLSGLLLMTPHNAAGGGATHVVMPETDTLPPHVAVVGFAADSATAERCLYYEAGICFVNMDGWSMDVLEAISGVPNPGGGPPAGAVSLTRLSGGRRLPRHYIGNNPGRRVRSRLTLRAGEASFECALGQWTYDPVGEDQPPEERRLSNVVHWTVPDLPHQRLRLVRRRLDPVSGDTAETIAELNPIDGRIELIVFHIPTDEAMLLVRRLRSEVARDPDAREIRAIGRTSFLASDHTATHFHAFYDLLHAARNERPLPHLQLEVGTCEVAVTNVRRQRIFFRSPRTFSCMVASASSG